MHVEHDQRLAMEEYRQLLLARRDAIAERWYHVLHAAFSPLSPAEVVAHLRTLVEQTIALLTAEAFDEAGATVIGVALAQARFLHPDALRATLAVLGEEFEGDVPDPLRKALGRWVRALLAAVAAGYHREANNTILHEQEAIRVALAEEREQIARALRESEARFRAVFAHDAIGITLADLEGHAMECNPAVERILGYRQEELQRLIFTEITYPDDVDTDRGLYRDLIIGRGCAYHKEKRYIHKHGHIVWCNLAASVLHDASGTPQFVLGMIEDITERKKTKLDIGEMQRHFTEREQLVLHRLAEGLTQEQIHKVDGLSMRTVGRIVASLEAKLDAKSQFVLGIRAAKLGLISHTRD